MTSTIKLRARKARNEEQYHEYATTALDILRTLEFAHHTDPVLTPRPYISSIQLRDNVLSHIRSDKQRQRLWSNVEKIVEANTNVQTLEREVEGGD